MPHHMLDVADPEEDFSVGPVCRHGCQMRGRHPVPGESCPFWLGHGAVYRLAALRGRSLCALSAGQPPAGGRWRSSGAGRAGPPCSPPGPGGPGQRRRLHPNDEKRIVRALEVYQSTGKTITQHNLETQAIPPRYDALTLALAFERREDMWSRIDRRVDQMMDQGLVDEVQSLLDSGVPASAPPAGHRL